MLCVFVFQKQLCTFYSSSFSQVAFAYKCPELCTIYIASPRFASHYLGSSVVVDVDDLCIDAG
jgi:hypothetical protein